MIKSSFEFDTLFSDIGQRLEERKNSIKPIKFKICSRCKQTKSIFKFSVNKRNLEGRTNICKECRSRGSLEYYYQNREKILIKVKEYQDNDKGRKSIYNKQYRKDHKGQLKKLAEKWYKSNKKAIKKRNLKYYQDNKEACNIRRANWIKNNKEKIRKHNREYHKLRISLKK